MIAVFWMETDGEWTRPCVDMFDMDKLGDALKAMERLRNMGNVSFVTMCSENPNSVGKPGVADPKEDYNWTKRRNNMPSCKRDGNGPPKSFTEY